MSHGIRFGSNVRVFDADTGELLVQASNRVVNAGLLLAARRWAVAESDPISHIAVGTGVRDVDNADVALRSEVYRDSFTTAETTADGAARLSLLVGSEQANGNRLSEAGIFNAAEGGTLFARVVFPSADQLDKQAGLALNIIWTIKIA